PEHGSLPATQKTGHAAARCRRTGLVQEGGKPLPDSDQPRAAQGDGARDEGEVVPSTVRAVTFLWLSRRVDSAVRCSSRARAAGFPPAASQWASPASLPPQPAR